MDKTSDTVQSTNTTVPSSVIPSQPPAPGTQAEAHLLLHSVRCLWDDSSRDQIRKLLTTRLNWDYLIEKASYHGILPWLYRALYEAGVTAAPDSVVRELRERYLHSVARGMILTAELKRLLQFLASENIATLPIKGPALAALLYGDPAVRPTEDLDLLIRKSDLRKAVAALQRFGYRLTDHPESLEDARYLDRDSEYHLLSKTAGLSVEVHWRIIPEQAFSSDFLWDRAIPTSFAGVRTLGLPLEELFFVLCVHGGAKHRWSGIKWIADIATLAATKSLNWSYLLQLTQPLGETRTIMVALCLIHRLFAVNLPADLVQRVYADPLNLAFVGLIQGRLFREDSGLPGWSEWFQYMHGPRLPLVRRSWLHSPWHCFLLYIRAVLTPEFNDIHALHLAKGLSILHYFYRFFRLFSQHGWGLLKRVR